MVVQPTVRNPLGAERMKKIVVSALFVLLCAAVASAFDSMALEMQSQRLKSQIELQIEQISRAREVADYRVGQRLAQLEAQLKLSEEDLERRLEELKALQQSLLEQMDDSGSDIVLARNELKKTLEKSYADVGNQIRQTWGLIKRVRDIRQGVTNIQENGIFNPNLVPGAPIQTNITNPLLPNGAGQNANPNTCSGCSQQSSYDGTSLDEIERRLAELQGGNTSSGSSDSSQPLVTSTSDPDSCPLLNR